jgi:hypothetical protein
MENVRRNFKGRKPPSTACARGENRQGRGGSSAICRGSTGFEEVPGSDSSGFTRAVFLREFPPTYDLIHLGSYLSVQTFGHLALPSQNKKRPLSDYSESGPLKNPKSSIWAGFGQAIFPKFLNNFWCRRRDSNPRPGSKRKERFLRLLPTHCPHFGPFFELST